MVTNEDIVQFLRKDSNFSINKVKQHTVFDFLVQKIEFKPTKNDTIILKKKVEIFLKYFTRNWKNSSNSFRNIKIKHSEWLSHEFDLSFVKKPRARSDKSGT
jgi:beta-xylosidase